MFNLPFYSQLSTYTFHYDESNNHRKFHIHQEKNSYNVDNDPNRKQAAATNFMLAGLVYKGEICDTDPMVLINGLGLQPTVKELKFNHIASGTFDKVLKPSNLKKVLTWILDSNLYIHYFSLNIEYWAFIDIIDDCVEYCLKSNKVKFNNEEHRHNTEAELKDALYRVLKSNKEKFLSMVKHHSYPSIGGKEKDLIRALHALTTELRGRSNIAAILNKKTVESIDKLLLLLNRSFDIDKMTLTQDLKEGVLVDGLAIFYQHRGLLFPNSVHVFDTEKIVESDIAEFGGSPFSNAFKHHFVDSESEPLTQISDVLAGLMAKYFEYIDRNTYEELAFAKTRFTAHQHEALGLLRALIEKSNDECEQFLHYVVSAGEIRKHNMFMFEMAI